MRPWQVWLRVGLVVENVLGQDHRDRTRRAAFREVKGAGHRFRGLLRLVDLDDLLGDIGQKTRVVLLLQGEAAEIAALDLADEHDERRRVVIGRVQRHHSVRQPGAARHDRNAGAVAQPPVGDRHIAGAGLVAAHDDADRIAFEQKARQPDIALAWYAIDLVDIMRFEAFSQQAGDGAAHAACSLESFARCIAYSANCGKRQRDFPSRSAFHRPVSTRCRPLR